MQTTTLVRIVRDPRTGEAHVPNERVAILAITQNLDRTLLKVRWEAGGDCVVFPDDVDGLPRPLSRICQPISHATDSSRDLTPNNNDESSISNFS